MKNFEAQKWSVLNKNLRLRRNKTQDKMELALQESVGISYSEERLSGSSEDSRIAQFPRHSTLPHILDKKICLVQTKDSLPNTNYSLI